MHDDGRSAPLPTALPTALPASSSAASSLVAPDVWEPRVRQAWLAVLVGTTAPWLLWRLIIPVFSMATGDFGAHYGVFATVLGALTLPLTVVAAWGARQAAAMPDLESVWAPRAAPLLLASAAAGALRYAASFLDDGFGPVSFASWVLHAAALIAVAGLAGDALRARGKKVSDRLLVAYGVWTAVSMLSTALALLGAGSFLGLTSLVSVAFLVAFVVRFARIYRAV